MSDATLPAEPVEDPNLRFTKHIHMGMTVYWYEQGRRSDNPRPGTITDIGTGGVLGIQIFGVKGESQNRFYAYRDGVKHIDDARLTEWERNELGAWDYPPWMKKPKPAAEVTGVK